MTDWTVIFGIASMLGSIVALVVALKKQPYENKKLDADAAKGFAEAAKLSEEAAQMSASRAAVSANEFLAYKSQTQKQLTDLQCEVGKLKAEIRERDERLEDLQDWCERLVHQVQSYGGVPVKIRTRSKTTQGG